MNADSTMTSRDSPERLPATGSNARLADAVTKVPCDAFAPSPASSVIETMLSGLELQGTERALCIGWAVGYPTAVLSHLVHDVHAIEIDGTLVEPQRRALARLGRTNVDIAHGDGLRGRQAAAPFQAILVTAAAPELPPALIEQLSVGGRIVIPLGNEQGQLIELLGKRVDSLVSRTLGGCALPVFPSLQRTPSTFPWTARVGG